MKLSELKLEALFLVVGVLVGEADRLFNVVIVIGGCVCGGGGSEDSSGESN